MARSSPTASGCKTRAGAWGARMDDPYHADAARFVAALGGGPFLFQCYADKDADKGKPGFTLNRYGTLATMGAVLAKYNARGAAVAILANVNDGTSKRKADNIRRVRALFVDLDGAPLEPVQAARLAPHVITETSPGRWHAYWRVADCPLSEFVRLQRALAERFNGDPSMADVARCVRLPGFWHHKGEPFLSRIVSVRDALPYTYAEILEGFTIPALSGKPAPIKLTRVAQGKRNDTLHKMAASAHRKGTPQSETCTRLLTVNAERCDPPLCADEVHTTVASAYAQPVTGHASFPLAVMQSPAYQALDCEAREVLLIAYCRYDSTNNGRITLTWADCREMFPLGREAFYRARKRATHPDLLTIATPPIKPSKGNKPRPAFYRLQHVISGARATYQAAA